MTSLKTLNEILHQDYAEPENPENPERMEGSAGVVLQRWRRFESKEDVLVAVKYLYEKQRNTAEADRFQKEAELLQRITSTLQHPGFATWNDHFETSDVGLVLVSEFVDGSPLWQWLSKRESLDWQAIIRLLLPVVDTIACFHKEKIGHRDISPNNLVVPKTLEVTQTGFQEMLDTFIQSGTLLGLETECVKVIDFGRAKTREDESQTQSLVAVGTEGFLAPEHARINRDDRPSAFAADVYSLGAILFYCLTKQTPHDREASPTPFWQRVRHPKHSYGELIRQKHPAIPSRLLRLIDLCLATTPYRRPTAKELKWLLISILLQADATQPKLQSADVHHGESQRNKTSKELRWWSNACRASSIASRQVVGCISEHFKTIAFVIVSLLLVVVAVFAFVLFRTNKDLNRSLVRETAAKQLAEQNEATAKQAQKVASRSAVITVSALRDMVDEVQRELSGVPGSSAARATIVDRALTRINEATTSIGDNPALKRVRGIAHDAKASALNFGGRRTDAIEEGKKSIAVFDELKRDKDPDPEIPFDLALIYEHQGDRYSSAGQNIDAVEWYKRSLEIRRNLHADLNTLRTNEAILSVLLRLVTTESELRHVEAARNKLDEAVAVFGDNLERDITELDLNTLQNRVVLRMRLGDRNFSEGKLTDAAKDYLDCCKCTEAVDASQPSWRNRSRLALSYERMAKVCDSEIANKRAWLTKAMELRRKSAAMDPGDASAQLDLARVLLALADVARASGDREGLTTYLNCVKEIRETTSQLDPNSPQTLFDLAVVFQRLAQFSRTSGHSDGLSDFIAAQECLRRANSSVPKFIVAEAILLLNLGVDDLSKSKTRSARKRAEEITALIAKLKIQQNDQKGLTELATLEWGASELSGDALFAEHNWSEARTHYLSGSKQLEGLPLAERDQPKLALILSKAYAKIGDTELEEGHFVAAREWYHKSREIRAAKSQDKGNVAARIELLTSDNRDIAVAISSGQFAEALRLCESLVREFNALDTEGQLIDEQWKSWIPLFERQRDMLQSLEASMSSIDTCKTLAPDLAAEVLVQRGSQFSRQGNHAEVANSGELLSTIVETTSSRTPDYLYKAACLFSMAATTLDQQKHGAALDDAEQLARQKYVSQAMLLVTKAVDAGYANRLNLETDPELQAIRGEAGFAELVSRLPERE